MKTPSESSAGHLGRNVVILVLLAGVVGLSIWVIQLRRDRAALEEQRIARPAASAPRPAAPPPATAPAAAPAPLPEAPAAPAASPPPKAPANPMAAMAAQMMNNPAMRDMIAQQQRRVLENQLGEVFNQLQFTPDQRTRFVSMMVESQAAAQDYAIKMMGGELSAADRQAMQQEMRDAAKAAEARVGEFFAAEFPGDPGKLEAFKNYTDLQAERTQVNALQTAFTRAGEPMSAEQTGTLMTLMNEERKAFRFTQDPNQQPADMDAALSPEAVDTMLREQEQLNNRIAERAATVLTPGQVARLRESQANRLQTMRASMELARQMLGTPK